MTMVIVAVRVGRRESTQIETRRCRSAIGDVLHRRSEKDDVSQCSHLLRFNTYATLMARREIKFRQNGADMANSRITIAKRKRPSLKKSELIKPLAATGAIPMHHYAGTRAHPADKLS